MSSTDKVMVDAPSIPDSEIKTLGSSVVEISTVEGRETIVNVPEAEALMFIDSDYKIIGEEQDDEVEDQKVTPSPEVVNPRGYQREMLERSLERNVIVAVSCSEYHLFEIYSLT
jgi:hypothetical protein